jgi:hypothetical protein
MSEATNQYSREHPGHAEPDRYLDDEGRCMFCGRAVALRERNAALEALEEVQARLKVIRHAVLTNDIPVLDAFMRESE